MRLLFLVVLLACHISCPAKDLGCFGATFPIAEESLLQVLESKLTQMYQSGQLEIHQKQLQERMSHKALNPLAVPGLRRAQEAKTFLYDPSITVPYDLKDQDGRIFHGAGTRVNPLTTHRLTKPLLFFNGEDPDQVAWALSRHQKDPRSKLILVQGSPFHLSQTHELRFYFDQGGALIKKLGIREVPALVTQHEDHLKITIIDLTQETPHDTK
ncbi:type-F conjugative transfer system protein TraW [Candidatus Odyssella thessalonicensis]|uniref:type-F conjugative transfer system protein TraW n=1 Tax=Candidatus Odyssella thessalonicensis TaxID=84647 RepID=UPI000225ACE5|nr:type-F conjugative transfer system protein TraW [Candidatus Odyssella thessalonicensis]